MASLNLDVNINPAAVNENKNSQKLVFKRQRSKKYPFLFRFANAWRHSCNVTIVTSQCRVKSRSRRSIRISGKNRTCDCIIVKLIWYCHKTILFWASGLLVNILVFYCDNASSYLLKSTIEQYCYGPNQASFCFLFVLFKQHFTGKNCRLQQIRTRIVRVEDEYVDH